MNVQVTVEILSAVLLWSGIAGVAAGAAYKLHTRRQRRSTTTEQQR